MLKQLVFVRVGTFRLFVGWDTDPVAATKPLWYGDGFQLGRIRADWAFEKEGLDYGDTGEVERSECPEWDGGGANASTREAA